MERFISIILIFNALFFAACSQGNENNEMLNFKKNEKMNDTIITSKNFVEKVSENIKNFEKEPTYFTFIKNPTSYELYINDLPIEKLYEDVILSSPIRFNKAILKSGIQEFKLRIFVNESDTDGQFEFDVRIGYYYEDNPHDLDKYQYVSKKELKKSDFKKVGENVYETIYEFESEVPYENEGWSNGQDLTKFDQKELEKAVLAFYQKMWNIYNDKSKIEEQFPLIFKREVESAQNRYLTKLEIQEVLDELMRPYSNPTYEMQPIDHYKIVYYGDGKMVALELETNDIRLRGKSALWAKYKDGNSTLGYSQGLLLYLPQGKSLEDGLEIIR